MTRFFKPGGVPMSAAFALLLVWGARADAQTTFQTPIWGGSVAHPFNDTRAAKPGWYHAGIDYWGPNYKSTYILASNVGRVWAVVWNGNNDHGMGNCVILRHEVIVSSNGATAPYYTLYAHLDSIAPNLQSGARVNRGQIIGTMGSTGYGKRYYWGATPHLHFEVKTAAVTQNPYGGGPYWGYTPRAAQNYGYIDPAAVIGRWQAR